MRKTEHGGNIYDYKDKMLDFSANINPLGMPESAKKAILDNIDNFMAYPDIQNRELKEKISRKYNIEYDRIVCGNGAAELIYKAVYAVKPKKALIVSPTFSEYEKALREIECDIHYYDMRESGGFEIDDDIFDMTENIDMLFICNPNNPTGKAVSGDFILRLADRCRENNTVILVDECFAEFCVNEDGISVIKNIRENMIILRAFTKIYAMAGVRLGFALFGDGALAEKAENMFQPWSVSSIASKCGAAVIDEDEFVENTKKYICAEREFLTENLKSLDFKVYSSDANYILFKSVADLSEKLKKYKILIRNCGDYRLLDNSYYRIAVRTRKENITLINALSACRQNVVDRRKK